MVSQINGIPMERNKSKLYIFCGSDLVTFNTKSYKVDFNDLGNAIGGGLGLYLGLSLLSVLTTIKSFVDSKM